MTPCCSQAHRVPEHILRRGPGIHVYHCPGCGAKKRVRMDRAELGELPELVDREVRKGGAA